MKKVLSLVLAVVLAFGMATVGFAATVTPIGISTGEFDKFSGEPMVNGIYIVPTDVALETAYDLGDEVRADTKLSVAILVGAGSDAGVIRAAQLGGANIEELTTAYLTRNKITLKKKVSKGGELIKDPVFKNRTFTTTNAAGETVTIKAVAIQIEFIDPFVSVKEKEFDFTIYTATKGTKDGWINIQLTGFMKNEEIEVDEDDEVNLSEGAYAKAISYTKGIKIDTGNGLWIKTNMFEDQKYYAKSVQEITSADDEIITKYPEIDTIYTLYKINLNSASNVVTFDLDDKYYVYNQDGKYLGMTTDNLPIADKYYLATKKIDMEEAVDATEAPSDSTGTVDVDSPITGGDDVPANANDNPGTGSNGLVNVAVVAGLVALAAGAVSLKK